MQVHSIISNTITQDIRQKGHQSIRLSPDGFSILIADASYKPVFLKQYVYDDTVPVALYPQECERVLKELDLITFEGETVFITDSPAVTLVPEHLFLIEHESALLGRSCLLKDSDIVFNRRLKDRPLHVIYSLTEDQKKLSEQITGDVKIVHTSECLISLSDQVQASDHQRGVILTEIQEQTMHILVILEDGIKLSNRYVLKDLSDFIYHTLNTFRQLDLNRENIPVYLSGIVNRNHELYGLLTKYIRQVKPTPYYLESLSKEEVLQYMILSEASKCA